MDFSGSYGSGFVIRDEKLDFDRDRYLEPYIGTHLHSFMSTVAQTQMFEQVRRYSEFPFYFSLLVLSISNVPSTTT